MTVCNMNIHVHKYINCIICIKQLYGFGHIHKMLISWTFLIKKVRWNFIYILFKKITSLFYTFYHFYRLKKLQKVMKSSRWIIVFKCIYVKICLVYIAWIRNKICFILIDYSIIYFLTLIKTVFWIIWSQGFCVH